MTMVQAELGTMTYYDYGVQWYNDALDCHKLSLHVLRPNGPPASTGGERAG